MYNYLHAVSQDTSALRRPTQGSQCTDSPDISCRGLNRPFVSLCRILEKHSFLFFFKYTTIITIATITSPNVTPLPIEMYCPYGAWEEQSRMQREMGKEQEMEG